MSRIRADQLVNRVGSGGPKFPNGVAEGFSVSGIVTATQFKGDGSQLSGIDASSLKDGSNVKVQAVSGGANVTGNVAATGNVTAVDGTFSGNLTVQGTTTTIDTAVTAVDSLAVDGQITGLGVAGVGTASPTNAFGIDKSLHVHSSLSSGTRGSGVHLTTNASGNTTNDGVSMRLVDTDLSIDNRETGLINFLTAGTERLRITSAGEVIVNGTATGSNAKFEVQSTTGSISSATLRVSGEKTSTGAINTGSAIVLTGHDGANSRDFASLFAGKENGTGSNFDAYLAFGTRSNGNPLAERLRITSSGHILPAADNTQDLGSSSKRFANIYTGDLNLSNEGSVNDVDGTWGQYTIQEGEDDLFLINRRTGKKYKFNLTEVD